MVSSKLWRNVILFLTATTRSLQTYLLSTKWLMLLWMFWEWKTSSQMTDAKVSLPLAVCRCFRLCSRDHTEPVILNSYTATQILSRSCGARSYFAQEAWMEVEFPNGTNPMELPRRRSLLDMVSTERPLCRNRWYLGWPALESCSFFSPFLLSFTLLLDIPFT